MKEHTINLDFIFNDQNLKNILKSFYLQIYDQANKLIFENSVKN